ncbi:MAG TPA: hypothetical protein VMJ75_19715 [Candidatus Acidoferrales bacterium]|nr:hypothetical protein [Candidatus Acidoferrales bacterium]
MNDDKGQTIKITRVYAEQGKSLFGEVEVATKAVDFAPPAPPCNISAGIPAAQFELWLQPPGWVGEWHCAPARLLFCIQAGEMGIEVSNGERRQFSDGAMVLVEDKPGQGHRSWVVGNVPARVVIIQLPEYALLK